MKRGKHHEPETQIMVGESSLGKWTDAWYRKIREIVSTRKGTERGL